MPLYPFLMYNMLGTELPVIINVAELWTGSKINKFTRIDLSIVVLVLNQDQLKIIQPFIVQAFRMRNVIGSVSFKNISRNVLSRHLPAPRTTTYTSPLNELRAASSFESDQRVWTARSTPEISWEFLWQSFLSSQESF